ncbi:MAG: chorismate mutase [Clostridia bacterium]|nr:chorismate mutase [Clostridia bacterium]
MSNENAREILASLRTEIDAADRDLIDAFTRRMDVAARIAECKKGGGIAVNDPGRERKKMADITSSVDEGMRSYTQVLYSLLFELSRSYQEKLNMDESDLFKEIKCAIDANYTAFPNSARVACQGVEGAYSQLACEKLFRVPDIMYFASFENVFSAIEKGLCTYGILPLENSTAGSVNKVYDLMMEHNFKIVRSVRLKVDHSLLANKGATLEGIKEIFSHEQAVNQSTGFLRSLGDVKITYCENTAVAAKTVAESGRTDVAALSSHSCAELYGLSCLAPSVQDQGNNYTRFICISKNLEVYPGADKTSIMMTISHKPGSLYRVLSRFYALGINLIKLESRPIPERDFEFMFYFDLETSIYSEEYAQLICELDSLCEDFRYLGSYSELV